MKTRCTFFIMCFVYTNLVKESRSAPASVVAKWLPFRIHCIISCNWQKEQTPTANSTDHEFTQRNNINNTNPDGITLVGGGGKVDDVVNASMFNNSTQFHATTQTNEPGESSGAGMGGTGTSGTGTDNLPEKNGIDEAKQKNIPTSTHNGNKVFLFFMIIIVLTILLYVVYQKRKKIKSFVKRSEAKMKATRRRRDKGHTYEKISSEDRAAVNSYVF